MRILIVGPGRAGGALALASAEAGHEVVGLVARSPLRWDLALSRSWRVPARPPTW